MKKFIAIFLLLQFLTSNAFAEELVKLPKLFIHYHHHSQEHKDNTGFAGFLVQHYSDKQQMEHDDADDKDCDLPFKHCDDCCVGSHVPLIAFLPSFSEPLSNLTVVSSEKHLMLNEKIESVCSIPVWQPPKFC